jgi:hypothetical protein
MSLFRSIVLLGLAALPGVSLAENLQSTIVANETQIWKYFSAEKPDIESFKKLATPDYLCIESNGQLLTLDQNLEVLKKLTFSSFDLQDPHVISLGSQSAVIVARVLTKGTYDGHPFASEVLSSTVWVREKAGWRIKNHTETPIKQH